MSIQLGTGPSGQASLDQSTLGRSAAVTYAADPLDAVYCSVCGCEAGVCAGASLHGSGGPSGSLRPVSGPGFDHFSPYPWAVGFTFLAVALIIGM